jgi:hypothetical protein
LRSREKKSDPRNRKSCKKHIFPKNCTFCSFEGNVLINCCWELNIC